MNSLDLSIETYLSNIHLGEFANLSIQAIDNLYTFKGLVLIPVLWWMWFQQDECREWRREMVLATLASGIVALVVGRLLTHWLPFRVRPVYNTELHLRFASGEIKDAVLTNWSSFPSDHAMLWMAVATGIFLMVRTHPQWLKVRTLIDEGAIGELRAVTGGFTYHNTNEHNIRNKSELGGGGLLDIGCYPITTSRFTIGREPRRVVALVERDPTFKVDRLGSVLMDFDGVQASFFYSTQTYPYQRMQFHGTKGRIEVEIPFNAPNDRPTRLLISEHNSDGVATDRWLELAVCDQYGVAAATFAEAILSGRPQAIPLEDARANMRVIDAVFRSAQSGAWESIAQG